MDPHALREPCLDLASSSSHDGAALEHAPSDNTSANSLSPTAHFFEPDCEWPALGPLEDQDLLGWLGGLDSANLLHNDAAAIIVGDCILDALLTQPPSPAAATSSCDAASKGEKRRRPKKITSALRLWVEHTQKPYATLEEKTFVARALDISVSQVTNFLNNYRKRYARVGGKLTSYSAACVKPAR